MSKLIEWFKKAIRHKSERWKEPAWVISIFCVAELPKVNDLDPSLKNPPKAFDLFVNTDDKTYCYWDEDENQFLPLMVEITQPLLNYRGKITLNPGDIPNVKIGVDTILGNVIVNLYTLVYPFGDRFPFITGRMDGSEVEKLIIAGASLELPENERVTPTQINKWKKAVSALAALDIIGVASGSRNSFYVKKELIEKRNQLLQENKDRLDDPVVITEIEDQLIKIDKEMSKGDVAENFFAHSGKLRGTGRKRQNIMYGNETNLKGEHKPILQALDEGMDFRNMSTYADTITMASQSRGLLTAQGGELVKFNLRMFQNAKIVKGDCGTKTGLKIMVNSDAEWTLGRHAQVGNKVQVINKDFLAANKDKYIIVRSPGYCLAGERDYCEKCVDDLLALRENSIAVATAATTNAIMQDAMKAMHGRILSSFTFVLKDHIS